MKLDARILKGVSETMLYTLYMQYRESLRPDGLLSHPRYEELVNALECDFSIFDEIPESSGQLTVVCRSLIFDMLTRKFIERHTYGTVASLGSGLDFRFERVDNGKISWFDIDLPGVIALRKHFFTESSRNRCIAASVPDLYWMEHIPRAEPVLFLAEGLFMYFTPKEVEAIIARISQSFSGSEMVLDVCNNWYVNASKDSTPYPFLNRMSGMWKCGMDDWQEIEAIHPGIHFIEEYYPYDGFGNRMPQSLKTALYDEDAYTERERDVIRTMMRIGHLRFGSP